MKELNEWPSREAKQETRWPSGPLGAHPEPPKVQVDIGKDREA